MSFNLDNIAHLARLALTNSSALKEDFIHIVAMVDQIQAVNTAGITPMSHPLETSLNQREDEVTEENQWSLLKTLAPKVEADLYLVPQVIE